MEPVDEEQTEDTVTVKKTENPSYLPELPESYLPERRLKTVETLITEAGGEKQVQKMRVILKGSEKKGLGLYANKRIEKGEVIAKYKLKAFNMKSYDYPHGTVYTFDVYRKNGQEYKRLVGDIFDGSFPAPDGLIRKGKLERIPYWAPFVNEPDVGKKSNSEIDMNLKENYQNRSATKAGQTLTYLLRSTKVIEEGEEITWYYGSSYHRDYEVGR